LPKIPLYFADITAHEFKKLGVFRMLKTLTAGAIAVLAIFLVARGISLDPEFFKGNRWFSLFPLFMACTYLCGRLITGEGTLHIAKVTQDTPEGIKLFADATAMLILASVLIWLNV
jgi:hypothetical protein